MVDAMSKLDRIVDLFSEGETVLLGFDDSKQGQLPEPVVVWVNKLNSFETSEAREDGQARRSERMYALGKEDAPERLGFYSEVAGMSQAQLAEQYADAFADEVYLEVMNDLETDPEQRERRDRMERLPTLLADADDEADSPRRIQLQEDQTAWVEAIRDGQVKGMEAKRDEALSMDRDELIDTLWERFRQRQTLDVFMAERRVTQLYYAIRQCEAVDVATTPGKHVWDHSKCDHRQRLTENRAETRRLPDSVVEKCIEVIDNITTGVRAAGNSDAPASSSASSEPASAEAAASTPSTPTAT